MSVSDKIEEARNCFHGMKESGRNNFQKYNYAELKDIVPIVRRICKEYKLKTKFDWDYENNVMTLTVTDKEDGSSDVSVIPLAPLSAGDPGKYMQDIGRIQTYARRYLYLQCFDIAVPDEIDDKDQRKIPKQKVQPKPKPAPKPAPKPQPKPEPVKEESEPTTEDIKEALDNVYDIIVNKGGAEFTLEKALFQLRRQYKDKPKLVEACEESLKTNSADKVET